jgi:hypothetical protein
MIQRRNYILLDLVQALLRAQFAKRLIKLLQPNQC